MFSSESQFPLVSSQRAGASALATEVALAVDLVGEKEGLILDQDSQLGSDERKQPIPKELRKPVSETELLIDGSRKLQQIRVIAQTLRDTVLLYLIDMAILQVGETLDRRLKLIRKMQGSIVPN